MLTQVFSPAYSLVSRALTISAYKTVSAVCHPASVQTHKDCSGQTPKQAAGGRTETTFLIWCNVCQQVAPRGWSETL